AVYNEAPTVSALLERVWEQPLPGLHRELIIVESNSTDGSRGLVAQFTASHPPDESRCVRVIHQPGPRGKGNAIREGLAAATGDIILIQDADLEYDVGDFPELLQPILDGRAQFVLGSRHLGAADWKIRKFATGTWLATLMNLAGIFFHAFFNLLFGTRLSDPTTMYKVFRADCLRGLRFHCDRFDFDWELIGKLVRAGYHPVEVPVSYVSRNYAAGKKIHPWRDPPTWIVAILRTRFERLYPRSGTATVSGRRHAARRSAVFLDRDGVLNRAVVRDGRPYSPGSLAEFHILPGVREALQALKARGYPLIVVTNQPDVARGDASRTLADAIHAQLRAQLPVDAVFACFHDDNANCACRKPKPGLLLEAAQAYDIDLRASFLVGDRWRDIEAGQSVGCTTFFIDAGYAETRPTRYDHKVASLAEARDIILALSR
ncbi:MAG TPA: HAD-IIIA family hydrolase, partial [Povalibacter sp.]|nr:HAD-IIIA family hydrolase [Povalibacter sp.]